MQKVFLTVQCSCDPDGVIIPTRIRWADGRCWKINKVLHTCTASHHEFKGIRYTIIIGSAEKYLYRDGQQWYVGCSP